MSSMDYVDTDERTKLTYHHIGIIMAEYVYSDMALHLPYNYIHQLRKN